MAETPRRISALDVRAAEKQALRIISSHKLDELPEEQASHVRTLATAYVATTRDGYSNTHALEVGAGLCRVAQAPIDIEGTDLDDVLSAIARAPDLTPRIIAGVHRRSTEQSKAPAPVFLGSKLYRRVTPTISRPSIIGLESQLYQIEWSVEQLFSFDIMTQDNAERDHMFPAILLYGPPGTGKSTLCRGATAHAKVWSEKTGIPFHYEMFSAADHSKWVGEGAKNVQAKYERIASLDGVGILVLDDLDMIFMSRDDESASHGGLQVTGQLMQELSGVGNEYRGNTLVLGTTNRPDKLDAALRRRFAANFSIPGYKTMQEYLQFVEHRCKWASTEEREALARFGRSKHYSPAQMDRLARHVGRQRLGRPCERPMQTAFNLESFLQSYHCT